MVHPTHIANLDASQVMDTVTKSVALKIIANGVQMTGHAALMMASGIFLSVHCLPRLILHSGNGSEFCEKDCQRDYGECNWAEGLCGGSFWQNKVCPLNKCCVGIRIAGKFWYVALETLLKYVQFF